MKKLTNLLLPGVFPLSICIFFGLFIFLYRVFGLPSPSELVTLIVKWFNLYGYWLLLLAAFLEGLFVIGMYFPGSLAIALAIYSLGKTPIDLFYIGIISFFAFMLSNFLNYYLGKYGYYKFLLLIGKKDIINKMQVSMNKNGNKTFFITGFFPNFIAITSVCAGISKLNFIKTISLLFFSLLFWVTVWTIVGSIIIKRVNLQDNNQSLYILAAIFLWAVYLIIKEKISIERKCLNN
jgi:membrane protein DedA with SNARE-associated domain